ncbi:MAG: spermine synthase [Anaerolineales bacterium]|nr:spermine synthase [Anaerolineales bacterium]
MIETKNSSSGHMRTALYLVAFVSGMTTLAVEISTSRLIGNVFGNSNIVWAGVIGMTLFYLMVGYFLGGRYADRYPSFRRFYTLVIWAALFAGTIPIVAVHLLRTATVALQRIDVATTLGATAIVGLLFVVPMTLLGCIPPFAVRLAVLSVSGSGRAAGAIYALTTVGGLLGTFGPVLVLIPRVGTPATFVVYAAILMMAVMVGAALTERRFPLRFTWMLLALAIVGFVSLQRPFKPPPEGGKLLYERETQYNYIQVVELPDQTRVLLLNEGMATHSTYHPTELVTNGSWDYFLAGPYFNTPPFRPDRVKKVSILGLAGGTIARQYTTVYGPIPIDGVEIDPGIVEVGRQFFDMDMPNLNVIVEDARFAMNYLDTDYQMIGIDAYRPPYIPWQLTTREFFFEVREHLADDGVVVINVGRTYEDRRLVEAMTATLLEVFPTVHTMDVPATFNTILVGTMQPTQSKNLFENFLGMTTGKEIHPLLHSALELAAYSSVPTTSSDLVFTDDRTSVELIADSIVLQFILGPEAYRLQQQLVSPEAPD